MRTSIFVCCNGFSLNIARSFVAQRQEKNARIVDYHTLSRLGILALICRCMFAKELRLPHLGGRVFRLIYAFRRKTVKFIDDGLAPVALVRPPYGSEILTFENFSEIYERLDANRYEFVTCAPWRLQNNGFQFPEGYEYVFVSSAGLCVKQFKNDLQNSLYLLHPRKYKNGLKSEFSASLSAMPDMENSLFSALVDGQKVVMGRSVSTVALALAAKDAGQLENLIVSIDKLDPLYSTYRSILEEIFPCM